MNSKRFAIAILVLAWFSVLAVAGQQNNSAETSPLKKTATTKQSTQPQDEGQHIFEQNCARCHNAPDGFSPRISGTIVRHMRVRASLSKKDEEALLRFFNP